MRKQRTVKALAKRLRQSRIAAGFATMEEAARFAGVRSGVYWRHENGTQMPTIEHAEKYAAAFGVDAGWLAFGP